MKNCCFRRFLVSWVLGTCAISLMVSLSPSGAMESGGDHYDKNLKENLEKHTFTHNHFIGTEEEQAVPLYDINQASSERILHLHQENLSNFQSALSASQLVKSWVMESPDFAPPSWSYWDYPWYALDAIRSIMPGIGWLSYASSSVESDSLSDHNVAMDNLEGPSFGFHFVESPPEQSQLEGDAFLEISKNLCASSSPSSRYCLGLSLDGGGVRGIMAAMWVAKLEQETNRPVSKLFDLIGGTSIGGIGALLLTASDDRKTPKMSGENLVDLIENHSGEIFPSHSWYNIPARLWDEIESLVYSRYSPDSLQGLLQQHLGNSTLQNPLTRILVTAVNADTATPRIFDSANPADQDCKTWEVGLCTSAAPTFFPAHRLSTDQQYYIDGGIGKPNPGLDVLQGLSTIPMFSLSQTAILSLGTGNMPLGKVPANAGISSVGSIIDALMMTQSKSVEMTLKELLSGPGQYFRANPSFDRGISLDQPDAESIRLLKEGAENQYGVIELFIDNDSLRKRLEADDQ